MRDLKGKAAWVTGAGSGIGRAAAIALGRAGMKLALSGRRREMLEETAAEVGGESLVLPLDTSDKTAVAEAAERIFAEWGTLDTLINNAGLNVRERQWANVSTEGWDEVINVDLNGPFYCIKAVLPPMRAARDGLIVNISSWAGKYASYLAGPAYTAAKHALVAMNETLNIEEGRHGIRACVICPEEVATPILDRRPVPVTEAERARMLQPEDLAEVILSVVRLHPRACIDEIVISPTWRRALYDDAAGFNPPKPAS